MSGPRPRESSTILHGRESMEWAERAAEPSLLELEVCVQQPLDGFQKVGHAIVPGNVLEDTDMVHEGLGRREHGGKDGVAG